MLCCKGRGGLYDQGSFLGHGLKEYTHDTGYVEYCRKKTYLKIGGHVASPIAPGSRTTGGVISIVAWSISVQIRLSRWRMLGGKML